ncbi:MAG: P-II family nitrogen regulator [Sulfolobales archaeon]
MRRSLYLVKAIVRIEKIPEILRALTEEGFRGATIYRAEGIGGEGGVIVVRGKPIDALIPRAVIEVVVEGEDNVEKVVRIIMDNARTGRVGDGRIYVIPVSRSIRIRTGEEIISPGLG